MFLERERDLLAGPSAEEAFLHQVGHLREVPGRDQVDLGREAQLSYSRAVGKGRRRGGIGKKGST